MDGNLVAEGFQTHGVRIRRCFHGAHLGAHEIRAPAAVGISVAVGSQKRVNERHVLVSPLVPPHLNHCGLELVVAVLAYVGATLVPQEAPCAIAGNGLHAAVPDEFRIPGPFRMRLQRLNLRQFFCRYSGALDGLLRHPGLNAAAAPGVHDDAHRHSKGLREPLGEEITHGGNACCHGRAGKLPLRFNIVLRLREARCINLENADVPGGFRGVQDGVAGAFNLLEAVAANRHVHVGLTGAYPDLSKHHVVHDKGFLATAYVQGVGAAGLAGRYFHPPRAVLCNSRFYCLEIPGVAHVYGLAGISPTPDIHRAFALEHGVIREYMREPEVCGTEGSVHQQSGYKEYRPFHITLQLCFPPSCTYPGGRS